MAAGEDVWGGERVTRAGGRRAGGDVGVQGLESVVRRRVCLGRAMPSGPGWWHCSVGATLPSRAAPGLALLAPLLALGTFVVAPSLARPRPCSLAHSRLLSTHSHRHSLTRSSLLSAPRRPSHTSRLQRDAPLWPHAPSSAGRRRMTCNPDTLTPFHHRALRYTPRPLCRSRPFSSSLAVPGLLGKEILSCLLEPLSSSSACH